MSSADSVKICDLAELLTGKLTRFHGEELGGYDVVVCKTSKGVSCFDNRCSHQDIPLSDFGLVIGDQLTCQAHGAQFSVADGHRIDGPPCEGLKCRRIMIGEDGGVWLQSDGGEQ